MAFLSRIVVNSAETCNVFLVTRNQGKLVIHQRLLPWDMVRQQGNGASRWMAIREMGHFVQRTFMLIRVKVNLDLSSLTFQ